RKTRRTPRRTPPSRSSKLPGKTRHEAAGPRAGGFFRAFLTPGSDAFTIVTRLFTRGAYPLPPFHPKNLSGDAMNTNLFVLATAAVLALSACKNETAEAQQQAAEAEAAADQAGAAATDAMSAAGDAAQQGAEAAAAATGEAAGEVAANVD